VTPRVLLLSLLAVGIGIVSSFVALCLLRLIALFTNLFYFQRWSMAASSPALSTLGAMAVAVPVVGALIVGLMARYGSDRIRGHGIPEALESGGAMGSMIAQLFHLSSAERKTLLVAGAAAGMSATFAAPLSAALLAVELLLFEWKPRSMIPVALASVTAGAARRYIMGAGPLFPVTAHPVFIGPQGLAGCVLAGVLAGLLSVVLTAAVYASEDLFEKLPIHWMWWPAIGGLVIGLGGLLFPQVLGVGYDTIGALLQGDVPRTMIAGVLVVKSVIWAVALGSGTSGGVLAPLLMMGGALGGLESMFLPNQGPGFWPLISMGAILGGTMRSPFTGIVFAMELTHDFNALLPLLVATVFSYAVSVLLLKRSILTEKVSRRGFHLSREYSVDPLEFASSTAVEEAVAHLRPDHSPRGQHLYPVLDQNRRLVGVITRKDLRTLIAGKPTRREIGAFVRGEPVVASSDEPLREVVNRMASSGFTRMPVLDREGKLAGMISLEDLLSARVRNLSEERDRERVIRIRVPFGSVPASEKSS
jgi:H+/Cl- antiporter ClcA